MIKHGVLSIKYLFFISIILICSCHDDSSSQESLQPRSADYYFQQANQMYNTKNIIIKKADTARYLQMISLIDSAINISGDNYEYYLKKSELFSILGKYNEGYYALLKYPNFNLNIDFILRAGMFNEIMNDTVQANQKYLYAQKLLNTADENQTKKKHTLLTLYLINSVESKKEFDLLYNLNQDNPEFSAYYDFINQFSRQELLEYFIRGGKRKDAFIY